MNRRETKNALAAKAADAKKAAALKDAGLSENATAAEVVRLFKSTAADVEKTAREGMKRLAELAGLLVEGYPDPPTTLSVALIRSGEPSKADCRASHRA